jgi:hypothetical protein
LLAMLSNSEAAKQSLARYLIRSTAFKDKLQALYARLRDILGVATNAVHETEILRICKLMMHI